MTVRGPGRPWSKKLLEEHEKRIVLVGLRITQADKARLDALAEGQGVSASTYAYAALLEALERDERKLGRKKRPR